jgi:hypothetical protein
MKCRWLALRSTAQKGPKTAMTIKFNCPKCNSLIAFSDRHAGKNAHCLSCGQRFIIPAKSDEKPKIIEPKQEPNLPLPGFYRAVFINSWKIFVNKCNATDLVFVAAAVCFRFFSPGACCLTWFVYFASWGFLLGLYLNIIYTTAVEGDELPEIYIGTSITFLWYIIKPFFIFIFVFAVTQIPLFIALSIFNNKGVTFENIWQTSTGLNLFLRFLFISGLFFFPTAILAAAMLNDITELYHLSRLITPVFKAFVPYLVVVGLLIIACLMEAHTKQFSVTEKDPLLTTVGNLSMNLAVQVVAIIAMRSIGLFYRHFNCYFRY